MRGREAEAGLAIQGVRYGARRARLECVPCLQRKARGLVRRPESAFTSKRAYRRSVEAIRAGVMAFAIVSRRGQEVYHEHHHGASAACYARNSAGDMMARSVAQHRHGSAGARRKRQPQVLAAATSEDKIDESLEESFPASDPPSWTLLTRIGSPRRQPRTLDDPET